jgi:sigma-E factor negative regulatory protein RseC
MLAFVTVAHYVFAIDGLTALSALIGLLMAGLFLRWYSASVRFDRRVQPVLVDDCQVLHLTSLAPLN